MFDLLFGASKSIKYKFSMFIFFSAAHVQLTAADKSVYKSNQHKSLNHSVPAGSRMLPWPSWQDFIIPGKNILPALDVFFLHFNLFRNV